MTLETWLLFLVVAIVAVATPGPAILLIMSNATLYGWKKTIFTAFGNISGLLVMGALSISGLSAILATSQMAFTVVKFTGAAYLIYLGIKIILQKPQALTTVEKNGDSSLNINRKKMFGQAVIVAMTNPKAILFLTALFPQFIDQGKPLALQFTLLMLTLTVCSFCFLMSYAVMAHRVKTWLSTPQRVQVFNRMTGGIFIGFGGLLAASSAGS